MLIPKPVAEGIRAGTVTRAFRWWDAPRAKVGGTQLAPAARGGRELLPRGDAYLEWLREAPG